MITCFSWEKNFMAMLDRDLPMIVSHKWRGMETAPVLQSQASNEYHSWAFLWSLGNCLVSRRSPKLMWLTWSILEQLWDVYCGCDCILAPETELCSSHGHGDIGHSWCVYTEGCQEAGLSKHLRESHAPERRGPNPLVQMVMWLLRSFSIE